MNMTSSLVMEVSLQQDFGDAMQTCLLLLNTTE